MKRPKLDLTPSQRIALNRRHEEIAKDLQPLIDACRDAERITAADLAVTIGPVPDPEDR